MCYTVRYFDKNNRPNTKSIWSERHVAIYHRLDLSRVTSRWIIIQSSSGMRSGLEKILSSALSINISLHDHLNLHLFFLLELAKNWRAYINFLEAQLNEMVTFSQSFGAANTNKPQ
jgi:hypothetical protein